jgi:hypothetical protein
MTWCQRCTQAATRCRISSSIKYSFQIPNEGLFGRHKPFGNQIHDPIASSRSLPCPCSPFRLIRCVMLSSRMFTIPRFVCSVGAPPLSGSPSTISSFVNAQSTTRVYASRTGRFSSNSILTDIYQPLYLARKQFIDDVCQSCPMIPLLSTC